MQILRSEIIALFENNAPWSTIRQCFPDESAAARFAALYFTETSAADLLKSGESIVYRVTWKRAFPKNPGSVYERVINLLMKRMEFDEITFQTDHAPSRAASGSIRSTHLFVSVLRILQILITLVFSLGLLGVLGAYVTLAAAEPFPDDDLRFVLTPIYICIAALMVAIGMALWARELTHGLPFGHITRCGFAPVKIERL